MIFTAIKTALSLFGGGGISGIAEELRGAYRDRLEAENDERRIKLDDKIATLNAERDALQAQRDVQIAEAGHAWNSIFRFLLAAPFLVFIWKVVVWDKVLKMGSTDDLSPDLWNILAVVYGFYFVYEAASLFKPKR